MKRILSGYCVAALTCSLAWPTGCTEARLAYDHIELGKPVPKGNLLVRDGKPIERGAAAVNGIVWPVPTIVGEDTVAILVDKVGNVTGKIYEGCAFGHWGLLLTSSRERAVEVIVPEEYYREPPPGWTSFRSDELFAQGAVLSTDPSASAPLARPQRAPANVQEYLIALMFPERPYGRSGVITRFLDCPLLALPLFTAAMYAHNLDVSLEDVCQVPASLAGITREGFDWSYTNPYGGTIRVHNLGGRRIRIESGGVAISDPFMLALYASLQIEHPDHRLQAALAGCTRLIRQSPDNPTLYLHRAAIYACMYDWDEALADGDTAARLAPKDEQVTRALTSLRAKIARYEDGATQCLLWTGWPDHAMLPATHIGEFTFEWDRNPRRWVALYTRILQAKPSSVAAFNNRGAFWYRLGRYREALADFSRALELDGGCVEARLSRAHTYARLGRFKEAWKDVDACPNAGGSDHEQFLKHLRTWSPRPRG